MTDKLQFLYIFVFTLIVTQQNEVLGSAGKKPRVKARIESQEIDTAYEFEDHGRRILKFVPKDVVDAERVQGEDLAANETLALNGTVGTPDISTPPSLEGTNSTLDGLKNDTKDSKNETSWIAKMKNILSSGKSNTSTTTSLTPVTTTTSSPIETKGAKGNESSQVSKSVDDLTTKASGNETKTPEKPTPSGKGILAKLKLQKDGKNPAIFNKMAPVINGRVNFRLKGIRDIVTPELFSILNDAGDGDLIMFASGSFRSAFLTAPTKVKLVQIPGTVLEDVISEVLKFMPLQNEENSTFVDEDISKNTENNLKEIIKRLDSKEVKLQKLKKNQLVDVIPKVFAMVQTGDPQAGSNIILKKGIVSQTDLPNNSTQN